MKTVRWMAMALLLGLALPGGNVRAADTESVESSPWVGWRKGYDCYDRASAFRDDRQYDRALELYQQSREFYQAVRRNFPDWNKQVIEGRIKLCDDEIANLRKLAGRLPLPAETAPPPVAASGAPSYRSDFSIPGGLSVSGGGVESASGGGSGRLYIEMQSELEQYRQRLRLALQEIDGLQVKLQQSEARGRDVDGVLRDYRLLQDKYALLEVRYKEAADRALRPGGDLQKLQNQMLELKLANDEAMAERRRLETELAKRDENYAAARREILALKDAAQNHDNVVKRLERDLELARNRSGAPAVPAADDGLLSRRVETLETELARKNQQLDRLMKLLTENDRAAITAELTAEVKRLRDELDKRGGAEQSEAGLRRKIAEMTENETTLRNQLRQTEDQLQRVNADYQSLSASGRQQTDAAQVTNAELKSLQQRTASLETELQNWTTRYNELEKRHNDRLKADSLNAGSLNQTNNDLEAKLAEAQKQQRLLGEKYDELKRTADADAALIKSSREAVMEYKTKLLSSEVDLRKLADLQKAYDELKAKFDLVNRASNSDVLAALNRIPGLEESLRRYEAENTALLAELKTLKRQPAASGPGAMVAAALGTQQVADLEKLENLLADARTAEARSNLEIAIWGYRQVLARDPGNAEAARRLGAIYLARGQYDDAVKLLEPACRALNNDRLVLDDLSRALIGKRDYARALALLADYRKQRQGRTDGNLLLTEGLAWSRSGKVAEAENAFKAVLKIEPANAEAAYELALMLSADPARRKEAGEFYLLAKEHGVGPDSYLEEVLKAVAGSDRATLDFLRKNVLEGLEKKDWSSVDWYLAELEKLAPGDIVDRRLRMVERILQGQPGEAVKLCGEPADAPDRIVLAAALLDAGRREDALKQLGALAANEQWSEAPPAFVKHVSGRAELKARLP